MDYPIQSLAPEHFPPLLNEIPQPPTILNYRGSLPPPDVPLLSVVGSRQYTSYGKAAVAHLIGGLAGYQVGIVSGLAIGIDGLAHEAALKHNLYTLAIPGGGLNDAVLYPARHKRLAYQILAAGGGLLSEYQPDQRAATWTFPQRNRLVCGMCQATLVIEAAAKSGSLITARMTVDYNRELLVVPGDIFSMMSSGTNQFLKLGATPVTTAEDIIALLSLSKNTTTSTKQLPLPNLTPEQVTLRTLLTTPLPTDELIRQSGLPTTQATVALMQLELAGYITLTDGVYRQTN